jgi:tripartite-type tricarboxylate transporter receptor subunit TctC
MSPISSRWSRRRLLAAGAALAWVPGVRAQAGDYPNRPIRLVIGYAAGGASDVPFRALCEAAGRLLGQSIVVENRTGAGGTLAAQTLAISKPDGYTLAQLSAPVFRLPHVVPTEWNPLRDFDYVMAAIAYSGSGLVVRADSPFKTIDDYLAHARANPGAVTYATPGRLTALHLMMEDLSRAAKVQLTHVPYKGDAESLPALLGGHVMSVAATPQWKPQVEAGKLRLLLSLDETRNPRHPDVKSVSEVGVTKPEKSRLGIAVRKGTDPAIVRKLHNAFHQAMESPEFKQTLVKFDMVTAYLDTADYAQYAVDKYAREKIVVETLGKE